ncbi:acetylxylan esterase [Amycolatopsis sp. NPDC059027]|uniref:acetylxylan esterase n=1 Tax=unclassified Amycolatopsis TaxID=2618356 RepID=UPI00366F773F
MTGAPSPRKPETAAITIGKPGDFDEFWAETLRQAEAVDPAPELIHRPDLSTERVTVGELSYTSFGGVRVTSWYAAPAEPAPPGGYPVVLHIPGYISEPAIMKSWAARGYVAIDLAPRGKLRANAVVNPGFPGLLVDNITDRFSYTYRGFYVDVVRALDVVADLPDVDGGRIGVWGSSQGGGLGIISAALRPGLVRCVAAGAPYLCGIMAATRLTHSYPYEEITEYLRVRPDDEALITETVSYYDGLNFAGAVRAPILVYLGMEDDVCPPETGFSVFRLLPEPKTLLTYERCAHHAGLRWVVPEVEKFLDGFLEPSGAIA